MKVLAEINGWRKVVEAPDFVDKSGYFEMAIPQVIPIFAELANVKYQLIVLKRKGYLKSGMPYFKYEDGKDTDA